MVYATLVMKKLKFKYAGIRQWQFCPAMQILSYSLLSIFIAFTINEHQNISIAGLNCQAGMPLVNGIFDLGNKKIKGQINQFIGG